MKFTILALAAALVAGKYDKCGCFSKTQQFYGEFCAAEFADAEDNCNAWGQVKKDTCADKKVCKETFKAAKESCGEDKDCVKSEKATMKVCRKEAHAAGKKTIAADDLEEIPRRAFKKWVMKNKKEEVSAIWKAWKEERAAKRAAKLEGMSEEEAAAQQAKWDAKKAKWQKKAKAWKKKNGSFSGKK